ncbi:ABC transporter permease subunit [Flavobacteriaceae bacterium Ap0902]|nr:ABC transporter permease subunit [Flavobacteriaceae bacterium Ap0902]
MIGLILNRLVKGLITLLGVVTVIFLLFNVMQGDPARMMLDQNEDPEQLAAIRHNLGLDQPYLTQYFYYLNDLSLVSIHSNNTADYTYFDTNKYDGKALFTIGDFTIVCKIPYLRESYQKQGKPVLEIIQETFPNTLLLALSAIVIAFILGIILGIISALKKDSMLDRFLLVITSIGMSVPSFFAAILIAWVFAYLLSDYTQLNMTGSLYEVDDYGIGRHLTLKNLILPALTLGIRPLAVITQLTRNSLLDILSKDYIRTAYAKGLTKKQVIWRHALKNALNPVITAASGWFAGMLAGAVFVEFIFGWNGLGKEIVNALNTLDQPVIMGAVLVIAISFILVNIVVDILYGVLDPRVRE